MFCKLVEEVGVLRGCVFGKSAGEGVGLIGVDAVIGELVIVNILFPR